MYTNIYKKFQSLNFDCIKGLRVIGFSLILTMGLFSVLSAYATGSASTIYVKAGGSCSSGNGSSSNPFRCLSKAQNTLGWSTLVVKSSSGVLDGGIVLKDGQNIVGSCSDKANRKIQNSSGTNNNGDTIVANGTNLISGISIPKSFRIGINGKNSTILLVDCVDIRDANTSKQVRTDVAPVAYGAIDTFETTLSGVTLINNVKVSRGDEEIQPGLVITNKGQAQRGYLVSNSKIMDTGFNPPDVPPDSVDCNDPAQFLKYCTEKYGILIAAGDDSKLSGLINNVELKTFEQKFYGFAQIFGANGGIVYRTLNNGRLPYSGVFNSKVSNYYEGIGVHPHGDYTNETAAEVYDVVGNSISNADFLLITLPTAVDYKNVLNARNNIITNNPDLFFINGSGIITYYGFFGDSRGVQGTYNITGNTMSNLHAGGVSFVAYSGVSSFEVNMSGNKMKNVGGPLGVTGVFNSPNWQNVSINATYNCIESSGGFDYNVGGILGTAGTIGLGNLAAIPPFIFGQPALPPFILGSKSVLFKNNNMVAPVLGNLLSKDYDIGLIGDWSGNFAGNYWASNIPGVGRAPHAPTDLLTTGVISGIDNYKEHGPTTCNVPDFY